MIRLAARAFRIRSGGQTANVRIVTGDNVASSAPVTLTVRAP